MAESVLPDVFIEEIEDEGELPSLTYGLDLERGRIIGMVDDLEAVNQFIRKELKTPRFKCLIYDDQRGSELKEMFGMVDITPEYLEAEIPQMVEDALMIDSRVLNVYGFSFWFDGDEAHIRFSVDTVFGPDIIEEVI